jgi:N-methylhydantoinase B
LRINGKQVDPKRQYVLRHGDTVQLSTPGGGGHGNPGKRSEAKRDVDLKAGYVTKTATPA